MFNPRVLHPTAHLALLLVAAICAAGCGGGASSDDPPWGLTSIEMPRSDAELTAVLAALPDEIDGHSRTDSGPYVVAYGRAGEFGLLASNSLEDMKALGVEVASAGDWVAHFVASSDDDAAIEASALEPGASLMWAAAAPVVDRATLHMLVWAYPEASRAFMVQAESSAARESLVEAFIDAVVSTAGGAAATPVATTSTTRSAEPGVTSADPTTMTPTTETVPAEKEPEMEGVAADESEIFLAEIDALRESAAVGRIVGFIHLTEPDRTWPLNETQPYCAGAGAFEEMVPGALVSVQGDLVSEPEGLATLRGSVYDAHMGCSMWFGAEVAGADSYIITVGGHTATYSASQLSATGWTVELWSSADVLESFCEEDFNAETCSRSMVLELSP